MTVRELRDILLKIECEGFDEAKVEMCEVDTNPIDGAREFVSILQIKSVNADSNMDRNKVVFMYQ